MKRLTLFLVTVLLMAALTTGALASNYSRPNSIDDQIEILAVTDRYGVVTQLDDDARDTVWYCPSDYNYYTESSALTFIVDAKSLREIWVRNGNHTSEGDYYYSSRPGIIAVSLYYGNGEITTYRYRMAEAFSVNAVSDSWNNGYQRILLPKTFYNVYCVAIKIETVTRGSSGSAQAAISDIVLAEGDGGSTPVITPRPVSPVVPVITSAPTQSVQTPPPGYDTTVGITAYLNKRIATRTGPSNAYDEPGSFFTTGAPVQVLTKAYDAENDLYWLQLEFVYEGQKLRAYTPSSRVDVDLNMVPDEDQPSAARITQRTRNFYGPGTDYKAHTDEIIEGTQGRIYAQERGYVLFEWFDYYQNLKRRAWIPANTVVLQ